MRVLLFGHAEEVILNRSTKINKKGVDNANAL
jgi:hypothetical protein